MERTISFSPAGEYVDNTVDGFGGASCVQRAENQVAGFGGGQGEGDGFRVAHLTDQNHVWSSRSAERSALVKLWVC